MKFGELIRKKRIKFEYSQREFANLLKVDQAYLSKLENDHDCACPSDRILKLIAFYLKLDLQQLKQLCQDLDKE